MKLRILAYFVAGSLGSCSALMGVWSADRTPATETISNTIEPSVLEPGQAGEVRYVFRRYRLCPRTSRTSVIDASGRAYLVGVQNSPPETGRVEGKPDAYARPFRVPFAAQPGPAIYQAVVSDVCNPLHRIWPVTKTIEIPFVIAPSTARVTRLE